VGVVLVATHKRHALQATAATVLAGQRVAVSAAILGSRRAIGLHIDCPKWSPFTSAAGPSLPPATDAEYKTYFGFMLTAHPNISALSLRGFSNDMAASAPNIRP